MIKICPNCGYTKRVLSKKYKFCPFCGIQMDFKTNNLEPSTISIETTIEDVVAEDVVEEIVADEYCDGYDCGIGMDIVEEVVDEWRDDCCCGDEFY